jgi:hypothetical protein
MYSVASSKNSKESPILISSVGLTSTTYNVSGSPIKVSSLGSRVTTLVTSKSEFINIYVRAIGVLYIHIS